MEKKEPNFRLFDLEAERSRRRPPAIIIEGDLKDRPPNKQVSGIGNPPTFLNKLRREWRWLLLP